MRAADSSQEEDRNTSSKGDSQAGDEPTNEKTPEGVSSPDKYSSINSITDKYDIRHPKSSISRTTARKMLNRDLTAYAERLATKQTLTKLKELKKSWTYATGNIAKADAYEQLNDFIGELEATLTKEEQ